jgi:5-oxoprolinase (ATP-hydrolysing) subunit B
MTRITFLGDAALLIEVVDDDLLAGNAVVHHLARAIREARISGVRDVVPAMTTVTVHVDPLRADVQAVEQVVESATGLLPAPGQAAYAPVTEIPVTYGGTEGPDLAAVAEAVGLTPADVVARHMARHYQVCYLGFLPGFAYLGLLDPRLRLPRRATPRARVPAGSVAVADMYTGVYPCESPGGWHLIGRTSVDLFDAAAASPATLIPGGRVRFVEAGR